MAAQLGHQRNLHSRQEISVVAKAILRKLQTKRNDAKVLMSVIDQMFCPKLFEISLNSTAHKNQNAKSK